jgi:YegS/Rv2252/BmrU family lipid kinase
MKCKTACLIVNPRSGKNVARLADILAVFSAAGWKTETALREFGGHTLQLAREAAEAGFDLVIGYGGDGTLNQVVNGVMAAKRHRSIIGVIPGGTANVWAHEMGIPEDPVKAALQLVASDGRKVDLGHVEVELQPAPPGTKDRPKRERADSGVRQHFLLMAGLGVDAAILRRVSTGLKEKIGEAAVAVAAAKEMPSQHAFPVEIRTWGAGTEEEMVWRGEALQIIVGNTRRYGNITEITPAAYIDDGVLDLCVITAGTPLTTMEQILSFLLHRHAGNRHSEYFQGAHFEIRVPVSVGLQLDGSRMKPKDYLNAPDRAALREAVDPGTVLVTYRFDAVPRALRVAVPSAYDDALFEEGSGEVRVLATAQPHVHQAVGVTEGGESRVAEHRSAAQIDALLEHGRKVTVVGVGSDPERNGACIVAGGTPDGNTGESKPVAVRIDQHTTLIGPAGEPLPAGSAAGLPAGGVIVVEGKQSKRGVIRATRVVVVA